jgi:hypothetical protein
MGKNQSKLAKENVDENGEEIKKSKKPEGVNYLF